MLLAACVAAVLAPRLYKGAQGTLRELGLAGHLPLDRQGQRKSSSQQQNDVTVLATKTRNWHVSFDNECRHVARKINIHELSD